jgi:hypothetical protein
MGVHGPLNISQVRSGAISGAMVMSQCTSEICSMQWHISCVSMWDFYFYWNSHGHWSRRTVFIEIIVVTGTWVDCSRLCCSLGELVIIILIGKVIIQGNVGNVKNWKSWSHLLEYSAIYLILKRCRVATVKLNHNDRAFISGGKSIRSSQASYYNLKADAIWMYFLILSY